MIERNLRELLLDLFSKHHLVSVPQIVTLLEESGTQCNKTSVYRSLEQLEVEGIVCKQYFGEAQASYELREDHHMHLVCQKCGRVTAAECDYTEPQQVDGFTVDHHHLTLLGVCANCSSS